MSSIGPSLPPHLLAKRKREEDGEQTVSNERSPIRLSPSSPESGEKRRRVVGPAPLPVSKPSPARAIGPKRPSASESSPKSRVLGPAPPPAPLDERPQNPPSDSEDSSDDDFGPAPPPANGQLHLANQEDERSVPQSVFDTDPQYVEEANKVQRDEWMMLPPSADDLASRMDPTKVRARKFNTGKSARGGGANRGDLGVWTETPEQKRKRLEDEMMGVAAPANSASGAQSKVPSKADETTARRIREHTEKVRGKSLMDQHQNKGTGKEKEDDPTKRAFDYEKDMGGGMKIGHKQRRELMNNAKGFGDRFSGGSYL